jgi:hypothetical protein
MKIQYPIVGIGTIVNDNRVKNIDGRLRNVILVNEHGIENVMSFQEVEKFYEQQRNQEQSTTEG